MKKNNLIYKLPLLVLFVLIFVSSMGTASAETWKSLLDYHRIENVDSYPIPVIPADYSGLLRYNSGITYKVVGSSDQDKNYAEFSVNERYGYGQEHYVIYENIGIYGGNYIDLKINVENVTSNSKNGYIRVYYPRSKKDAADDFLRIDLKKDDTKTDLSFEFYNHGTDEQIDYQGVWNYKRVNKRKSVVLSTDPLDIPNIYTQGQTELIYSLDIPNKFEVIGQSAGEKESQEFSVTFDTNKVGMKQSSHLRKSNTGYLKYEQEPITKMEVPTPQIVGHQTNYPEVKYTIAQDMPLQLKASYYPKNYTLSIYLDRSVELSTATVNVKNIDDEEISFFDVTRDEEKHRLIIRTDDITLQRNADTSYLFDVSANLKESIDLTDKYKDGFYYIPATVSYTTQENNSPSRSADSKVQAALRAKGKLQSVAQYTSTQGWNNKTINDLFEYALGVLDSDELEITNIENKTFNTKGTDSVKVTLRGKKSGLSKTFNVPVNVVEEKQAMIHFLDEKGNELEAKVIKKGFEGETYDFSNEIKKISGYKFKHIDESKGYPIKGVFNENSKNIDIFIIYELDELDVTVNYLDQNGEKIAEEVVEKYLSNNSYDILSKNIPGYSIKSVTVNGKNESLIDNNKVNISVGDKSIDIVFSYEAVHYSLNMTVDKKTVSQRDKLSYTLDIISGMKYEDGDNPDNYEIDKISISIDSALINISNVKVLDKSNKMIGIGQLNEDSNELIVNLTEAIKVTEDFRVTYDATVKDDAITGEKIKAKALMKAKYQIMDSKRGIDKESNIVNSTIAGGLQLVSAPQTIDFGKVTYQAKETVVENPVIDEKLLISDTRSNNQAGWKLYASIESPLVSEDEELEGSIIYRSGDNELVLSKDNQEVKVHSGGEQSDYDVTSTWGTTPKSDGIKLKFKANDMPKSGRYEGKIRWTLTTGMP